jgi:organic radical activating enzyme
MTAAELAQEAVASGAQFAVITGGEPTVYDLRPLTDALDDVLLNVHLETSGAFEIKGEFDWITLSPKKWKSPLAESVELADEFKIIVEEPADIAHYLNLLEAFGFNWREQGWRKRPTWPRSVWLHPEWSQRDNKDVLNAISNAAKKGIGILRAGFQMHKLYRVDLADYRSRAPVPLGGNMEKGF